MYLCAIILYFKLTSLSELKISLWSLRGREEQVGKRLERGEVSPRCHKMHGQGRWPWLWDRFSLPWHKWDCSDMGKNKILKAWPGIRTISLPISIAAFSLTQTP